MDNREQIQEIIRYRKRLSRILNQDVDLETAATIWIRKYAGAWRKLHQYKTSVIH